MAAVTTGSGGSSRRLRSWGRIVVSTEIDATPGQVWHVVEPVERHVDWKIGRAHV